MRAYVIGWWLRRVGYMHLFHAHLCAILVSVGTAVAGDSAAQSSPVVQVLGHGARGRTMQCTVLEGAASPEVIFCDGNRYRLENSMRHGDVSNAHCENAGAELLLPFTRSWWVASACSMLCVLCAALAAGLTLGVTSLDEFQLKILCNRKVDDISPHVLSPEMRDKVVIDQAAAASVLPLISGRYYGPSALRCIPRSCAPTNNHYLLVTLLIANAAANEALPVVFDKLVPTWVAVVMSVTVVLIFGEILPSAVFTGPRQLTLASTFSPFLSVLKTLLLPMALPISLLLDKCMLREQHEYTRADMKALVRTLRREGYCLEGDEAEILHGVLEMHRKSAEQISAPLSKAKMLPHDIVISEECIAQLEKWGHSRVFVYRRDPKQPFRRDDIVGVLLVKKIISIDPAEGRSLKTVQGAVKLPVVLKPSDNLLDALSKFRDCMCHLAVVSSSPEATVRALAEGTSIPEAGRPRSFCSLEDVIEAMLKKDIYDEADAERGRWLTQRAPSYTYSVLGHQNPVWGSAVLTSLGSLGRAATEEITSLSGTSVSSESE